MDSRPLRVLAVSTQQKMLRQLSKFLKALGYQVQQVADARQAGAALEHDTPDFLILDCEPTLREALQLCRASGGQGRCGCVYTLLLTESPTPDDVKEAIQAGVDDFLAKPIVHGELLARLRAGARMLEFERRLHRQTGVDPLTGLPDRRACCDGLRNQGADGRTNGRTAACIVADLDFLGQVNLLHGRPAGDAAIRALAARLVDLGGPLGRVFSLGGGRFAVLFDGMSEPEAVAWADRARQELAEMEIAMSAGSLQTTTSFGVAVGNAAAQNSEELLDRATQTLVAAKASGRNCVVGSGDLHDDAKAWIQLAAPGRLFERTLAKDVMTPYTLAIIGDQTIALANELLGRFGLGTLPVVDRNGEFRGIVTAESIASAWAGGETPSLKIADVMTTDVTVFEPDATFAALRDFFTREGGSLIVVLDHQRPIGLVTPDNLAALSMPLTAESFARAEPYSDALDYLRIGDLCPLRS